jgi:hypothetical protein
MTPEEIRQFAGTARKAVPHTQADTIGTIILLLGEIAAQLSEANTPKWIEVNNGSYIDARRVLGAMKTFDPSTGKERTSVYLTNGQYAVMDAPFVEGCVLLGIIAQKGGQQ